MPRQQKFSKGRDHTVPEGKAGVRVLVRFRGDNDFGGVMRAFGDLILPRLKAASRPLPTESQIARWFNEVAPVLFEAAQRDFPSPADEARLRSYLRIGPEDVHIGEEADRMLETHSQWGNYDSVLVDTRVDFCGAPHKPVTVV